MGSLWKIALLAMPVAACSTPKVSTREEAGAAQATAQYRTYAWLPTLQRDASHNSPLAEAQLKQSVDRDLAAKDFRRVSSAEHPDFLVGWHLTTQAKTQVEAINPYWGYGWGPVFGPPPAYGGAFGPGAAVAEYEQGTVILDVVDACSNRLIWRGTAMANLGANPSAEKVQKQVNQAADKILARFPPMA